MLLAKKVMDIIDIPIIELLLLDDMSIVGIWRRDFSWYGMGYGN